MHIEALSNEQAALEREGIASAELQRKKSRRGFWTRPRMVAIVAITFVVLLLVFSVVTGLL
jgi:hypothetical protein